MKKNVFLSLLCFLLLRLTAGAQDQAAIPLELTQHKTTSLIFSHPIKSVDRGSLEMLAYIPSGMENILQVKAALRGMGETNLTVITTDGFLYTFDIRYADKPRVTRLTVQPADATATPVLLPATAYHMGQLKDINSQLVHDERFYYGIRNQSGRVKATLEGIYIHGNTLFFRLVLTNRSPIPYELDFTRFSVRDRKQARRTARQETVLSPIYVHGAHNPEVDAGHRKVLVFALDKFTIARDKELLIGLFERQGGRHLQLGIKGSHLLDACQLRFP